MCMSFDIKSFEARKALLSFRTSDSQFDFSQEENVCCDP